MTNTQSPAPGVAATVERLMSLADEFADDRGEATRPFESQKYRNALESALHGALQGGVSADVTDDQVRAALNTFNNDNNETGTRAMRRALEEFLASRTPAPGMAGGVGTWTDLEIEGAVELWFKHHTEASGGFTARERTLIRSAIVAAIKAVSKPAAPHPAPAQQAAGADVEHLTSGEQKAVLKDLRGIASLINRHDCWITEAEGMDMDECVPYHERRIAELLALGRAIIAEDPEIWTDEDKEPFKPRYSEGASTATGRAGS